MKSTMLNRAPLSATQRVRCAPPRATSSDKAGPSGWFDKGMISLAAAAAVTLSTVSLQFAPIAEAKLTAGDPIKNASAILQYALPINNKPIREIQKSLESISDQLRIPGSKALGPVQASVRGAQSVVTNKRNDIIKDFAPEKKEEGIKALDALDQSLNEFVTIVTAQDKQQVPLKQREALKFVGIVEESMVKGVPFEVPAAYANLPILKGRATMEMKVALKETPQGPRTVVMTLVADGYNAPVSAGSFVDLVLRGFYDGMEIQRSDGFVVQTGDPEGDDDGFRDPKTNEIRRVPLEILVAGDKEPVYDESLEDLARANEPIVLPFNAYGTIAWARNEFENNSASSQVFFLLKESELTPSGSNLLDGRFAVLGYVTNGQEDLGYMKVGDKIEYVKVIDGKEKLVNGP